MTTYENSFRHTLFRQGAAAIAPALGQCAAAKAGEPSSGGRLSCAADAAQKRTGSVAAPPRWELRADHLSGRMLARTLSQMRPLARIQVVTRLALSSRPAERLALADALARTGIDVLGAHSIIEHLARDPMPQVRRAAARAAWARFSLDPARLVAVLDRLAHDPDKEVRDLARLAGGPAGR